VEMHVLRQADVRSKLRLIMPCEIRGSHSSSVFWDVFSMVASHPHFGRYFFLWHDSPNGPRAPHCRGFTIFEQRKFRGIYQRVEKSWPTLRKTSDFSHCYHMSNTNQLFIARNLLF
jgi:hypothetical protein